FVIFEGVALKIAKVGKEQGENEREEKVRQQFGETAAEGVLRRFDVLDKEGQVEIGKPAEGDDWEAAADAQLTAVRSTCGGGSGRGSAHASGNRCAERSGRFGNCLRDEGGTCDRGGLGCGKGGFCSGNPCSG